MFSLKSKVEKEDMFNALLYMKEQQIGSVHKDDQVGIQVNLNVPLTLQETLELLKLVNGIKEDFYKLPLEFCEV